MNDPSTPSIASLPTFSPLPFCSRAERLKIGKKLRAQVPRTTQAEWQPSRDRRDPIDLLEESNQGRLPELIPIRYGRMLKNPFTFLRGSAALMAYDLASTPTIDIAVQACGDCHALNFGLFATPERNLVFDLNDFDETHPAPWEWDLKRLAASFFVGGRSHGMAEKDCQVAAIACARSYREHLWEYSQMSPLEVWYMRLDVETLIAIAPDAKIRKKREQVAEKARQRVVENLFPKIVSQVGGRHRFVNQPPILYHPEADEHWHERIQEGIEDYRQSLSDERRVLLDRYHLEDYAVKVVGIGSVGTRCFIALFFSEENHPLILQVKEARRSVLEPYTKPSHYENQGQRVVMGQRLMQSSSDIFLGWVRGRRGYDFFVRQLRDMKMSFPVENVSAIGLKSYAELCGWALARAHAKSGDVATISGYLGQSDQFDQSIGKFARAYADQNEQDYAALVKAVKKGRVQVLIEEDM